MKYLSRLMALLCVLMLCVGCAWAESTNETLDSYNESKELTLQAAQELTDELLAHTNLSDMYLALLDVVNGDRASLLNVLSEDQVKAISDHANALYQTIEEPDEWDYADLVDLVDTLSFAKNGGVAGVVLAWTDGGPQSGTVYLSSDVTIRSTITVASGQTLNVNIRDGDTNTYTIKRASGFTGAMFNVAAGGRLRIQGYSGRIIVDGGAVWSNEDPTVGRVNNGVVASDSIIECAGYLTLSNMIIQNNDYPSGEGGAIRMYKNAGNGDGSFSGITIRQCAANIGGAIKIDGGFEAIEDGDGDGYGFTVSNSDIYYNESYSVGNDAGGGTIRTNGGVAGVYYFNNCRIYENKTMRGGAFYWNAAGSDETKLIINNSTLRDNYATNNGGAIMNESIMEIKGTTRILNNYAGNVGGGIWLSTYRGGAAGYGGDGYSLTLGSAIEVSGNEAANSGGGIYLSIGDSDDVDKAGALFSCVIDGAKLEGNKARNGGAIAIEDDATRSNYADRVFTVNAGSILSDNTATQNGGAVYIHRTGNKEMTVTVNGTIEGNESNEANGGAFYMDASGSASIEAKFSGTIKDNTAVNGNGGAVYLAGGNFSFTSGEISGQNVEYQAQNGGAVYVTGGRFTMTSGTMTNNTASKEGGAVYVDGGNFTMEHGTFSGNSAVNGGAVYVNGGSLTMTSGSMTDNHAQASSTAAAEAGEEGFGGAVFANGGDIKIGIEGCTDSDPLHTPTNYTHPVVSNNTASFGGGLAVRGGTVYLYCCDMTENESSGQGTGMNVFMDEGAGGTGGTVYHYTNGADIGEDTNHGMVSIGGKLIVENDGEFAEIEIVYHSTYKVDLTWSGKVPSGYYLNLPYCPNAWQNEQYEKQLTFVGWAETSEGITEETIRSKDNYKAIGDPVPMIGNEGKINFYAVWAPATNRISYAYTVDGKNVVQWEDGDDFIKAEGTPSTYLFNLSKDSISLPAPSKAGYSFKGWKMYANLNTISNWGADSTQEVPKADPLTNTLYLPETDWNKSETIQTSLATEQNFGDITFVAIFEPAFSGLRIIKSGADTTKDPNQTFIFSITGTANNPTIGVVNMQVMIVGNGNQVVHLPVGTYTVTELENWSWRYDVTNIAEGTESMPMTATMRMMRSAVEPSKTVKISNPTEGVTLTFTNSRIEDQWLDGSDYEQNEMK